MQRRSLLALLVASSLAPGCAGRAPAAARPAHDGGGGHHQHGGHHAEHADHDFADADRWAAVFDDPARDEWQRPDEVVALLELAPGLVVADLGAGTGYFEHRLSRAVGGAGKVLALDVEPAMVRHLEERGRREGWGSVEARVVPVDDPGLGEASVDRVLIVDTWHHLGDRGAYAGKLARALRAGGRIAVVDFTIEAPVGPPPAARLPAAAVVAELAAAGLDAGIADESLPHQYVVIAVRRAP
jgi:predicted methyltransferase